MSSRTFGPPAEKADRKRQFVTGFILTPTTLNRDANL